MDDKPASTELPHTFDRSIARLCNAMAACRRGAPDADDFTSVAQSRELIRLFVQVRDEEMRRSILTLLRAIVRLAAQD